MPDINYVNPQINNITQQEISIQVSLNGFSFLIKSSETQSCLLFRNYKFDKLQLIDELIRKIEQKIVEDQYIKAEFSKAELIFISQKATLVPSEFFDTKHLKKYFEFNHNLNELDELHYTHIPAINAYNVFSVPNYLTNIFYDISHNITFKHQATSLISYGYNIASTKNTILINIHSGFFDIVIFENKQLLLYNSFQYTNSLDFLYFFLYPLNQLKIDASNQNIIVLGETIKHVDIIKELKSRVNKITYPILEDSSQCKHLTNSQKLSFFNLFQ